MKKPVQQSVSSKDTDFGLTVAQRNAIGKLSATATVKASKEFETSLLEGEFLYRAWQSYELCLELESGRIDQATYQVMLKQIYTLNSETIPVEIGISQQEKTIQEPNNLLSRVNHLRV